MADSLGCKTLTQYCKATILQYIFKRIDNLDGLIIRNEIEAVKYIYI